MEFSIAVAKEFATQDEVTSCKKIFERQLKAAQELTGKVGASATDVERLVDRKQKQLADKNDKAKEVEERKHSKKAAESSWGFIRKI